MGEKVEKAVSGKPGQLIKKDDWGLKKLAYPIGNKTTGYYQLLEFKAEPTLLKLLETEYRRDERIMRNLTVSLDKYAVEFNENRRQGKFNKKEKQEVAA